MKRKTKIFISILLLFTLGVLISLGVAYQLTHRTQKKYIEKNYPSELQKFSRKIILTTKDSLTISGVMVCSNIDNPFVLLLHANQSNYSSNYELMDSLNSIGINSVSISLRAHGSSDGEINDVGFSARYDVIAAVEFINKISKNAKIIIAGRSLGAAAAIFASKSIDNYVHAYILEAPYYNLQKAVKNRLQLRFPTFLADIIYYDLLLFSNLFIDDISNISPFNYLKNIQNEKMIKFLTGDLDDRAPLNDIKKMAASKPNSELVVFKGANHQSLFKYDKEKYINCLIQLLPEMNQK